MVLFGSLAPASLLVRAFFLGMIGCFWSRMGVCGVCFLFFLNIFKLFILGVFVRERLFFLRKKGGMFKKKEEGNENRC